MKKLIAALLTLLLLASLAGCQRSEPDEPAPGPEPPAVEPAPVAEPEQPKERFAFTRGNFPRLDGSTATAPLAEALCAELLGESREEVGDLVRFSKTTQAYYNLMDGEADLLIVYEANEEVYAERERRGFAWEKTPFANDAFVFVVNENNPVDSITVEQARGIYSGAITNWSELGGRDEAIVAFQRNKGAGSQTLMEKLVMRGTPMADAPTDYVVSEMGELIEAVKSCDGQDGAIGYTVYYYASEMKMARGLKLLALEGVEPTPETIRAGSYPLINPNYVVLPADAAEDAPNRALYDWLLSEEGQRLVAAEGYVSILDVPTVERRAEPEVGSRRYAAYTGRLIPDGGYGVLIPYAGQRLMDDWPALNGCLYGLMTADGEVVVDPVYSSASRPMVYSGNRIEAMPLLVLERGDRDAAADGGNARRVAVAAADGSWCTGFDYDAVKQSENGLMLFSGDGLTLMNPDGSVFKRLTREGMHLSEDDWSAMRDDWGGVGGQWIGDNVSVDWDRDSEGRNADGYPDVVYYSIGSAARLTMPYEIWEAQYLTGDAWQEPAYAVEDASRMTDLVLGGDAPGLLATRDYGDAGVTIRFYREDGTPLPELTLTDDLWYQSTALVGGLIERVDLNTATYYDLGTMEVVFRTYLGYEED